MKKKWLISVAILAVVAIGVGVFFAFNMLSKKNDISENTTANSTVAKTRADGDKIIIGMDTTYPPMDFLNADGLIAGFDYQLLRAAMKKMNQSYEIQSIDWGAKEQLLESKEIDMVWSTLTITDERKKVFLFSEPYFEGGQIAAVRSNSLLTDIDELGQKTVAIQSGGFVKPVLEKYQGIDGSIREIKEYSEVAIAMTTMLQGKDGIDAVVGDSTAIRYYVKNSEGRFRVLDGSFIQNEAGVGVRKSDTELIGRVNRALAELKSDGTYQKLYNEWFSN